LLLCAAFIFTACGGGRAYGGKFTEVSAAEKAQVLKDFDNALKGFENNWDGYTAKISMNMDASAKSGGESVSMKMKASGSVQLLFNEGDYIASGNMSLNMSASLFGEGGNTNASMKFWLKDGWMYMDGKADGESVKGKEKFGDSLDYGTGIEGLDFDALIESYEELLDKKATVSVTASEGARNIKLSGKVDADSLGLNEIGFDTDIDVSIVVSLDKDGNVNGFQMTMGIDMKINEGGVSGKVSVKAKYTYEPFSGKISFPKGMEDWEEIDDSSDYEWDW
jgi:hypothetical protein